MGLQARGSEAAKGRAAGERTQDDAESQRLAPILEPVSQLEHRKAHRKKTPGITDDYRLGRNQSTPAGLTGGIFHFYTTLSCSSFAVPLLFKQGSPCFTIGWKAAPHFVHAAAGGWPLSRLYSFFRGRGESPPDR